MLCTQADYESDSRRKLDGLYQEVKKKLEDEQNKRTRDHNSAIAVNEKLYGLEKQVSIMLFIMFIFSVLVVFFCGKTTYVMIFYNYF